MTKQLYLNDSFLFELDATVMLQNEDSNGSYLILDQTIFYPQGGGQPSDQGMIKTGSIELHVTFVKQFENEIRHYLSEILLIDLQGRKVHCLLNSQRRLLNTRYHTGSHLLGHIVETIYPNIKAIKGHSFPEEAYLEFIGEIEPNINTLQIRLNEFMNTNYRTQAFNIDQQSFEAKYYKLPYQISSQQLLRVIQIGNFSPIPCGGTHLKFTNEITNIIINKIKVKRGITRISYKVQ